MGAVSFDVTTWTRVIMTLMPPAAWTEISITDCLETDGVAWLACLAYLTDWMGGKHLDIALPDQETSVFFVCTMFVI